MTSTIKRIQRVGFCLVISSTLATAAIAAEGAKDNVAPVEAGKPAETTKKADDKPSTGGVKLRTGAKVYVDNCRICHGDRGDGNTRARGGLRPPPRDFTTIEAALELTNERMIKSVTEGRPGTGMMSHKDRLTKQQIADVVDFLRTSFMRKPNKNDLVVKNIAGRKIYTKNCSVCHGDNGNTAVWAKSGLNPPPRDFTAAESAQVLTRKRMINSVTNGRPGTGMMPFSSKLNETQVAQVVDYIREVFLGKAAAGIAGISPDPMKMLPQDSNHARMRQGGNVTAQRPPAASKPAPKSKSGMPTVSNPVADPHANMGMMAAPTTVSTAGPHTGPGALPKGTPVMTQAALPAIVDADMSLPMPGGLKGDRAAGRKFFLNNCFTCHGVKGEGNGPRAHFNTPRPRNFTTAEAARMFNRVRLFDSITNGRVGTVMPAWSKVLTPQQIANVAEFVFQEFILAEESKKTKKSSKAQSDKKKPS